MRRACGGFLALAPGGRTLLVAGSTATTALVAQGAGEFAPGQLRIGRPRGLRLGHARSGDTGLAAGRMGLAARQRGGLGGALDYGCLAAVAGPGSAQGAGCRPLAPWRLDSNGIAVLAAATAAFLVLGRSGETAADFATLAAERVRSTLLTACLPRVDIALRRASAASLAVLLLETTPREVRARGAGAR